VNQSGAGKMEAKTNGSGCQKLPPQPDATSMPSCIALAKLSMLSFPSFLSLVSLAWIFSRRL
jgi:hypothetical protein